MGRFATKLAQAAGSLSTLALLPSGAQATIVYNDGSPLSLGFSGPGEVTWDIDGNGRVDYRLFRSQATCGCDSGTFLNLGSVGLAGWGLVQPLTITTGDRSVIPTPNPFFNRLASGFIVGPSMASGYTLNPFSTDYRTLLHRYTTTTGAPGSTVTTTVTDVHENAMGFYPEGGTGFIGFAFSNDGGVNLFYGWAELTLYKGEGAGDGLVTISRWAYESCANQSISVGATSGGVGIESCPAVPEPDSLALLGFGLGGLRAFRGRKRMAAR